MFALQDPTPFTTTAAPGLAGARCADPDVADAHGAGSLADLFFSDEILDIRAAKAICGSCDVAASCLDGALERREPWGVWGGQLFRDGKVLPVKRPRGRPPKDRSRYVTA